MAGEDVWDLPCHSEVPWDAVEAESEPITRTRYGSIEVEHFALALQIIDSPTVRRTGKEVIALPDRIEEWRYNSSSQRPEDVEKLLGFARETELFIGNRHVWLPESHSRKDEAGAENLVRFLNEMLPCLKGIEERDITYDAVRPGAEMVNFERNLIAVGGPVSNWYNRNLIFDDELDLPYKFHLNPEPETIDLSDCSPYELRLVGKSPDSTLDRSPNWYISEEHGVPATFDDEERARPERSVSEKRWETDYFMIVKAENIHWEAKRAPRTSLTLAGCHGFGTYAAIESMLDPEITSELADTFGDGYFQAVGKVTRADNEVDSEDSNELNVGNLELLAKGSIDV